MVQNFYVLGSKKPRPDSQAILFVDGSADQTYREDIDLELSHWVPNRTPDEFKAGTPTEICLKFIEKNLITQKKYDLVVNNHLDTDGVLSVYSLIRSEISLKQRDILIQAAEMGDFFGWGVPTAQMIFLALTELFMIHEKNSSDLIATYEHAFHFIDQILTNDYSPSSAVRSGMKYLQKSKDLLSESSSLIQCWGDYLVSIQFKLEFFQPYQKQLLAIAQFNELITDRLLLWPHAINQYYSQKIKLISVQNDHGWFHDLYYPAYIWADTKGLWRAPGFTLINSTNAYFFGSEAFTLALDTLQGLETQPGSWYTTHELHPFSKQSARDFPVVASFLDQQGQSTPSSLHPDTVAKIFSDTFQLAPKIANGI